jgi:hypothetical protein
MDLQATNNINDTTPREILSKSYSDNHLEQDGGQSLSSVKIEMGSKFHFYFPNFNSRRKAVVKHDIHHLLTGYSTTLKGESEISMWEIASGCKAYKAAFLIDTSGAMLGFLINYWSILKAFARGRRTKNLYHDMFTTEQALDMKVSGLRHQLLLDEYPIDTQPTFTDFILFNLFALYGLVYSVILWVFIPFIVFYSIYIELKTRFAHN